MYLIKFSTILKFQFITRKIYLVTKIWESPNVCKIYSKTDDR